MARIRSPNYPSISLPEAVERIHKVHGKAHTHKVDTLTIAKAAGYSGLNGAALGLLSALKKYGLLEEVGDDVRVSALGITIIADPTNSPERRNAIQTAAFSPSLFADIRKQYPGSIPGDDVLRSYLVKRGFAMGAVSAVLSTFRETMRLVTDEGLGYDAGVGSASEQENELESTTSAKDLAKAASNLSRQLVPNVQMAGTEVGTYPVSADCKIKLIATGPYDKTSIEALVKQLQLNLQLGVFQVSTKSTENNGEEDQAAKHQLRRTA